MPATLSRPISALALAAGLLALLAAPGLAADGNLDTSFHFDGKAVHALDVDLVQKSDRVGAVATQGNGRIILAGSAVQGTVDANTRWVLVGLTPSGELDPTFGIAGKVTISFSFSDGATSSSVNGIAFQPDGKILVVGQVFFDYGWTTVSRSVLTRRTADGDPDPTFAGGTSTRWVDFSDNFLESSRATFVGVRSTGEILVAGLWDGGGPHGLGMAQLLPDGSYDESFSFDGRRTHFLGFEYDDAELDPEGRLVVVGSDYRDGTNEDGALGRFLPDGTPDASFAWPEGIAWLDFGGTYDFTPALTVLPDSSVVAVGETFTDGFSNPDFAFAKVDEAGVLDPTFGIAGLASFAFAGAGFTEGAEAVVRQSDGKLLVAGNVQTTNGYDFGVVRLLPDGAPDTTFGSDGKRLIAFDLGDDLRDTLYALTLSGGRAVVAGDARVSASNHDYAVARLTSSLIFSDDYEFGNDDAWSLTMP